MFSVISKPFIFSRRGAENAERFGLVKVALLSGGYFFYHEEHEGHEGLVHSESECSLVRVWSFIFSRKDRKGREEIWVSERLFAQSEIFFFTMKSMEDMKGWFAVYSDAPPDTEALHFLTQRRRGRREIWVNEGIFAQSEILNLYTVSKERIEKIINPLDSCH
jgi:hypothetical protein